MRSGKYFQMRYISEGNHDCEYGQLETVDHIPKESTLDPAERGFLKKIFRELNLKILFDTKKGLGVVVKFLDSLL